MTLTPQLITASTARGKMTFVAFTHTGVPFFACHPALLYDELHGEYTSATEWSITHLPTGYRLPFTFPGIDACERFMALIAPICHWGNIHEKIAGHRAKRRLGLILMRYVGRARDAEVEALLQDFRIEIQQATLGTAELHGADGGEA